MENNNSGRAKPTQEIKHLLESLEKHHSTQISTEKKLALATIFLAVLTAFLALATFLLWHSEEKNSKIIIKRENLILTANLCRDHEKTMDELYGRDSLKLFKNWLDNKLDILNPTDTLPWKAKRGQLLKNKPLNAFFNFVDEAKVIDEQGCLDTAYFSNHFQHLFFLIGKVKSHTAKDLIDAVRQEEGAIPDLWEGYEYFKKRFGTK